MNLADAYEQFKKFIDVGDIVWAKGSSFKTKTGEISLKVTEFELLSKCLYPLPEKFHGFKILKPFIGNDILI